VRRLQDSLEVQISRWWSSSEERGNWLLWIIFMGYIAAAGRAERGWFVREAGRMCQLLGIGGLEELKGGLMRVVWQDGFCMGSCVMIWDEICKMWRAESGFKNSLDQGMGDETGVECVT
jgi:hypothetical protein